MRRLCVAMLSLFSFAVSAATPLRQAPDSPAADAITVEDTGLRSIAGWLKQYGREGYVAADVADAMGIPRLQEEELLDAKQRGYRSNDVLRIAQISADEKRDFLLFMVQRPDDQVYFYFSTVRDGLIKAFVSIPSKKLVMPLERVEAELRFQEEVHYWGERMEAN